MGKIPDLDGGRCPEDREKEHLRAWQPKYKQELWAYFAVLTHINITVESCIEDYWKSL